MSFEIFFESSAKKFLEKSEKQVSEYFGKGKYLKSNVYKRELFANISNFNVASMLPGDQNRLPDAFNDFLKYNGGSFNGRFFNVRR